MCREVEAAAAAVAVAPVVVAVPPVPAVAFNSGTLTIEPGLALTVHAAAVAADVEAVDDCSVVVAAFVVGPVVAVLCA